MTPFDNPHPQTCTCPNCGYIHFNDNYDPYRTIVFGNPRPKSKKQIEWEKLNRRREARDESFRLSLGSMPTPIVRKLVVARLDPLRHHKLRCTARRPKLSLRERVLA